MWMVLGLKSLQKYFIVGWNIEISILQKYFIVGWNVKVATVFHRGMKRYQSAGSAVHCNCEIAAANFKFNHILGGQNISSLFWMPKTREKRFYVAETFRQDGSEPSGSMGSYWCTQLWSELWHGSPMNCDVGHQQRGCGSQKCWRLGESGEVHKRHYHVKNLLIGKCLRLL